jgi:hypothetical protein
LLKIFVKNQQISANNHIILVKFLVKIKLSNMGKVYKKTTNDPAGWWYYFETMNNGVLSTYLMLMSILENKDILSQLSQNEEIPAFSLHEWTIIEALIDVLAILHAATLQIQDRRCSISKYIPICLRIR